MTVIGVPVGVRSEVLFLCPSQSFLMSSCASVMFSLGILLSFIYHMVPKLVKENFLFAAYFAWVKPKFSHRSKASHHRLVVTGTKHELNYGKTRSLVLRGSSMV